jgi:uncharacterized protein YabN with tetrapyrrole methylase and pyrophosphatase domain
MGMTGPPQMTLETLSAMTRAETLFHVVTDPVTEYWLQSASTNAISLRYLYGKSKPREQTYREMADRVVAEVRRGADVCAAFYGHPGVFVDPAHQMIARLRSLGHEARMLPGISADACLYADLGINPGDHGLQSFEATDFLLSRRRFDSTSGLMLWQIGVLGDATAQRANLAVRRARVSFLVDRLRRSYPPAHPVVLYRAATFAGDPPRIRRLPLRRLPKIRIDPMTTMYLPPMRQRVPDRGVLSWFAK